MSARPRPVTATVTKPEWMKAEYAYRPYNHSLDSSGSTESLISCLDHDSYESSADDEQEFIANQNQRSAGPADNKCQVSFTQERNQVYKGENSWSKKKMTRKVASNEVDSETLLSPWEKWLVQKAKEDREARVKMSAKKKEEKLREQVKQQEKQAGLERAKHKQEEWLKKKDYETKLRLKLEQQRLDAERDIKDLEKKQILEKSETKFKEWQLQKRQEERLRKKKEKAKLEEEERKRRERKELAEKKFAEWRRDVVHRPKSAPSCHGDKAGDYPAPSFYNPIPWQPIPTPRYKEDQKKPKPKPKKKKYVWNPNKYL